MHSTYMYACSDIIKIRNTRPTERGGQPGPMSLGGPQAKRGKKPGCTLSKANKIKCVLS